ncbi:uncharacterized protein TEOVI_000421100 [Trypanosoma equiperdum]|uniref:Uncharacterized protein n=2 Tax=Trypanozoon TaxID=39700 RepID=Q583E3_TRYB2|nr:hypothetical protein, conserved [Trypanosoma brucei brucei TREU927]AAX80512.1 hypothetical protein, conserved [Trypanosoma brucei]AAZ11048.1 hypothetical protein, conserved [Trypanosoma brucei brucei TREU927]SCU72633.1 hypothetical protein, conserved [Trypanosoma equiperdum]
MGAVPSRESLSRGLCRLPDYGQKHKMVLIPLTKEFFPSPDCLPLRQLFEARKDPFVHYYHTFDESFTRVQPSGDKVRSASATTSGDGNSVWHAEEFVPLNCTPEEFYDAYVTRARKSLIFDTDKQMFDLNAQDPEALRPVPCAIAFVCGPAGSLPGSDNVGRPPEKGGLYMHGCDDDAEFMKDAAEGEGEDDGVGGAAEGKSVLEESVVVCGLRLRVVGFVGDVNGILPRSCDDNLGEGPFQLQVFLNKSVGDHNFVHAFISAIYTYVAQWREALAGVMSVKDEARLAKQRRDKMRDGGLTDSPDIDSNRDLLLPPVGSVVIASRRANVPMLCFQRVLRATLSRLFAVAEADKATDPNGSFCSKCGNRSDHVSWLNKVGTEEPLNAPREDNETPEECATVFGPKTNFGMGDDLHMWLDNDVLFTRISQDAATRAVGCIARRMDCPDCITDIVRPKYFEMQEISDRDASTARTRTTVSVTETVGSLPPAIDARTHNTLNEAPVSILASIPSRGTESSQNGNSTAVAAAAAALKPHRKLNDRPGGAVVVEAWPEGGIDLVDFADSEDSTKDQQLHLYWVVGHSKEAQRTATVALSSWKANGRSVVIGRTCCSSVESGRKGSGGNKDDDDEQVSIGELIHLMVDPCQSSESQSWVIERLKFPLEELLLSELHNSCKLAREAHVDAENWIRYRDSGSEQSRPTPLLLPPDITEGNAEGSPELADAVAQLVGEGTLCLWRLSLVTGAVRVVAVTPYFLRPPRKKRSRRKVARRQRVLTKGVESSTKLTTPAPTRHLGPPMVPQQSKAKRTVTAKATTTGFLAPMTTVMGPVKTAEQGTPFPLVNYGVCKEGAVPPMPTPNFPSVGFGYVLPQQRLRTYGSPAPAHYAEPLVLTHEPQHDFPCFNQPVVGTNRPPASVLNHRVRHPPAPFTSSRSPTVDPCEFVFCDDPKDSRRGSSNRDSHRVSIPSFSTPHWDDTGVPWSYAASGERSSTTRGSSIVGNQCSPFPQSADKWLNPTNPRSGAREKVHYLPGFRSSFGGISDSDDTTACVRNRVHSVPTNLESGKDVYSDRSGVMTPSLNVWVRHGLQH